MEIKLISIDDAPHLSKYYNDNKEHLTPWEPIREPGFHDVASWETRLKSQVAAQEAETALHFVAFSSEPREIMAVCNLTGIVKGPFQACFMGYSVAMKHQGKGVMRKLCNHAINYAFEQMQLNRVMANHMPRNTRSERLLTSIGFEREGLAKKYLCINGKWEDHVLNSIINPKNRD